MDLRAGRLVLRLASMADRERIYRLRHDVYARELRQHPVNAEGRLTDRLDGSNVYLVAAESGDLVGFVSVTPPWAGRYSVDKYLSRADWPDLFCQEPGDEDLFEIRILTVCPPARGSAVAPLLMYAALRWIVSRGGRRVVALGRAEVLDLYLRAGLRPVGQRIRSGEVTFELLTGEIAEIDRSVSDGYQDLLRSLEDGLDWRLDMPFLPDRSGCFHGGASFDAIGSRFDRIPSRSRIVAADVLDAWFPPAPGVVEALAQDPAWLARTSPPTGADGLVAEIASARGVPESSIVVGAGSSDLIFRAFRGWLTPASRVLLLDPTYGEYAHVLDRVVGCRWDRFPLRRADGWRVDLDRLRVALRTGYDLAVLVNPNNPTGRHVGAEGLRAVLAEVPLSTTVWVDEAYVDYVGPDQSLESFAAASPNIVVCKSLSKVYALSGLRAAYLVGPAAVAAGVRRWTPPWAVSLPAQIASVGALRDPGYYRACWARTGELRAELAHGSAATGEPIESVANFVVLTLPPNGPTAGEVVHRCRERGVYLRDLTPMSAMFEEHVVRIAVRTAEENARIIEALAEATRATAA